MVSLSIRPLTSLRWSSAFKLSDGTSAEPEALISLYHQLTAFFRKKKSRKFLAANTNFEADVDEGSPEKFSVGPTDEDELVILEAEPDYSSECFCEICFENKEKHQMFTNDACTHSFCNECTTSHVVAKIQGRVHVVPCPALNCKAALDFEACRRMIPIDACVQWDELLCMSLIPESKKLYCPFLDCSAMLVNECGDVIKNIRCVVCSRPFCGECRVPWHSDFTCKEFKKLHSKNGEEEIVKALAKKKKWMKCPNCRMYVERSDGCLHMICLCNFQFCYKCGGKWSALHEICYYTTDFSFSCLCF